MFEEVSEKSEFVTQTLHPDGRRRIDMSKAAQASKKTKKQSIFRLNSAGAELVFREDCVWWERLSQCFALVIFTIFPLMVGSRGFVDITDVKFYIFAVNTCVYIFFCSLIGMSFPPGAVPSGNNTGKVMRSLPLQKFVLPQILICAYMLWAVICTLNSPYKELWFGQARFEGLCSLLLYGVVFVLMSFWGEYTDAYFYGLAISGAGVGLVGFAHSMGSSVLYPKGLNYWNTGFLSTIGQQDCLAGLICITVPVLLCAFVILRGKWLYLFMPALFLLPYLIVYTDVETGKLSYFVVAALLPCLIQSRDRLGRLLTGVVPVLAGTALGVSFKGQVQGRHFEPGTKTWLLLFAGAVFWALGWLISRGEKPWKVKPSSVRRAGYAVLLAVTIAGIIYVYCYSGDKAALHGVSQILHGHISDEAGTYRGYIWKNTVKIIMGRPVFGGGPGSFFSLFMPYNGGYNALSHYGVAVDLAHNDFLNIAACTGLPGLGLYIAFLVSLAVRCIRAEKRCPVMLIFMAGLLGYLVYSFFVFSIAIVSPLFWVLAGVADKCARQAEKSPGGSNS